MSSRIPEQMTLCQALSWIAFRNDRFVTSDPHELRRNMQRHRKRLLEPNPAGDFLKMAQAGQITAHGKTARGVELIDPLDWVGISEAELWDIVEDEWARAMGVH
jgi:hypothetical protein